MNFKIWKLAYLQGQVTSNKQAAKYTLQSYHVIYNLQKYELTRSCILCKIYVTLFDHSIYYVELMQQTSHKFVQQSSWFWCWLETIMNKGGMVCDGMMFILNVKKIHQLVQRLLQRTQTHAWYYDLLQYDQNYVLVGTK